MSDDGIFDDEVVEKRDIDTKSHNPTQTQPDVRNLISDIFGDSDEEDEPQTKQLPAKPDNYFDEEDDNIFDSDDENARPKAGRLQKKSSLSKSSGTKSRLDEEGLLDSDDDEVKKAVQLAKKRKHEDKIQKKLKKKKSHMLEPSSKKSKHSSSSNPSATTEKEGMNDEVSSGDEYDSGEEVVENEEDRNFIDRNDDHADLLDEYNADNQDFGDDRPDADDEWEKKNKKKGKSSQKYASAMGGSSAGSTRNLDPLSETLTSMKNPKVPELAEMDKENYVAKLQKKMEQAVIADNECLLKGQPAIHKLKLIPALIQTFNMKSLQNTLLERDILCNLRDFLEPKDKNTLPALAVRAAIYDILLKLAVTPEYLKRVNDEKPPIGAIIVQLRKHKMETDANKRILKEIMDKWSRPIFAKSVDVRSNGGMTNLLQENLEVQEAMRQKYAKLAEENAAKEHKEGKKAVKLDAFMTGVEPKNTTSTDYYNRARTPYSQGFLFTVQPELKSVDKTDIMEKTLGEGRMKLFKKMGTGGGAKGEGLGRKVNPRAMDMAVSSFKV